MPVWEFRLGLSRGVGLMWTGRRRLVVSEVGLYREDRGLVGEAVKLEDGACLSCCILLLRFGRIISIIQLCVPPFLYCPLPVSSESSSIQQPSLISSLLLASRTRQTPPRVENPIYTHASTNPGHFSFRNSTIASGPFSTCSP
jgi:hypothetical protein